MLVCLFLFFLALKNSKTKSLYYTLKMNYGNEDPDEAFLLQYDESVFRPSRGGNGGDGNTFNTHERYADADDLRFGHPFAGGGSHTKRRKTGGVKSGFRASLDKQDDEEASDTFTSKSEMALLKKILDQRLADGETMATALRAFKENNHRPPPAHPPQEDADSSKKESSSGPSTSTLRIHCNSDDRDAELDPDCSKFRVPFFNPNAQLLRSIELVSVNIPYVFTNINSTNNTLYLSEVCNTPTSPGVYPYPVLYKLVVPDGMYGIDELINKLNELRFAWQPVLPTTRYADGAATAYTGRETVHNTYYFRYTLGPYPRVYVTYEQNGTDLYDSYIQCSPEQSGYSPGLRDILTRTLNRDKRIVSAKCPSANCLQVTLASAVHNITYCSMLTVLQLNIPDTSKKVYFRDVYTSAFEATASTGGTTVTLYIDNVRTTLANAFGLPAGDLTNVAGYLRVATAKGSLWPALGFTKSLAIPYTSVDVLALSSTELTVGNACHIVTEPMLPVDTTTVIFDKAISGTNIAADNTPIAISSVNGSVLLTNAITFSGGASTFERKSWWKVHRERTYIGDEMYDLRGNSTVLMRLKVNDRYIGEIYYAMHYDDAEVSYNSLQSPIFAVFGFHNVGIGQVFQVNREMDGYIGKHRFITSNERDKHVPLRLNELAGEIVIELLNSEGRALDMENVNWSCVFELEFGKTERKQGTFHDMASHFFS